MRRFILTLGSVLLLAAPLTASAQEDEEDEGPASYLYTTYHYCSTGGQDRADEIYEQIDLPIMTQLQADGKITAFGWLRHHTGGKWRRAEYFAAPSLDALLDAQEAAGEAADAADPEGTLRAEFAAACSGHDDYIWASDNVGTGATARGPAGFSVYYICDENREERADDIVAENFAPIYNQAVTDGKLTSWGWSGHWVGGKYRRLLTTTAADFKTLLNTRNEIIEASFGVEGMEEIGEEFTDICGSHSDYMWEIVHEMP
jgi:hypothetical protein